MKSDCKLFIFFTLRAECTVVYRLQIWKLHYCKNIAWLYKSTPSCSALYNELKLNRKKYINLKQNRFLSRRKIVTQSKLIVLAKVFFGSSVWDLFYNVHCTYTVTTNNVFISVYLYLNVFIDFYLIFSLFFNFCLIAYRMIRNQKQKLCVKM